MNGKIEKTKKYNPKKTTSQTAKKSVSKKVEKSDKSLNCGLYKIKNKFVFDTSKSSAKPEDEHLYVVFTDKNNNVDRIVGTTHLYEKKKSNGIQNGELKVFQFGGQNEPSGVYAEHYKLGVDNKPFKIKNFKKSPYTIKEYQAQSIFDFAKNKRR